MEIYNKKIEKLYKEYKTNINGLTEEEAKKRLEKYGENKLKEQKKKSNILIFLSQFKDLMVIMLICASIISAIISYFRKENYIDSIMIIVIVIINAILSFIQEKKADNAIEELNKMFITNNKVIRDGKKETIDVREIVIGDIVELEAGDYISADARIISCDNLEVNESTLTGESKSIKKQNSEIKGQKQLYERSNMVYAGCNVTNGHAYVLVIATAMDTELGKIAGSLLDKKTELTPLQKKVNQISKILTYIIITIIIIMMITGLLMKNSFFDILMLSISLAVAAIPEGLSSIITIILSLGMSDMARKNVIIRKMASVETLGSTNVICSDKTGTITQNKMLVKFLYVNDKEYDEVSYSGKKDMLKLCATLNHNVTKNGEKYIGDETEVAIYKYFEKDLLNNKRLKEYPFDSDRKMMSTINKVEDKVYSFTKGSLYSILSNCNRYIVDGNIYKMTEKQRKKIYKIENEEASKSLRILGFAYKDDDIENPEKDMIFIGLIGMMDPPRKGVENAINICKARGIKPIMITGDSINTATAIAKQVGIIDDNKKAIEGKNIEKMTDEELKEAVKYYQVYARITPNSKLRIVEALQKQGLVVAMTGDGVNDAPAIQKANIGIGMGITGTEVVKKVSDCILVDDSFSTIVDGVEEGRRITSNIKKVILYLLAGNMVEVVLVFVSMILGMEMFTTLQLLWINLVTDSIPAIMLSFEKADNETMTNIESNKGVQSFFTPFLIAKIAISTIFKSLVIILVFLIYENKYNAEIAGSLMFILLIAHELLFSLSCRNLKHSVLNKNIFENKRLTFGLLIIMIIQILVLTTGTSHIFISQGIKIIDVFIIISIAILIFIIGELVKRVYVKLFADTSKIK